MIKSANTNIGSLDWTIWLIMMIGAITIILSSVPLLINIYKKNKIVFLNTKKIVYSAIFLSLYLTFAIIDNIIGKLTLEINDTIVVSFAFLFGPLEGMLFAWIADTTNVLINGWQYSFLSSTLLPLIALVSGTLAILNKIKIKDKYILPLFQGLMLMMAILMFLFLSIFSFNIKLFNHTSSQIILNNTEKWIFCLSITFICIGLCESVFFYIYYGKNIDKKNLNIFILILLITIITRIITIIIRPFSNYYLGYSGNYQVSLIEIIVHSTYLIPLQSFVSYSIVSTTIFILNEN